MTVRIVGNREVDLQIRIVKIRGGLVDVEWRHTVEGVEFGPWQVKTLALGDTLSVSYSMHIDQPAFRADHLAEVFEQLMRSMRP